MQTAINHVFRLMVASLVCLTAIWVFALRTPQDGRELSHDEMEAIFGDEGPCFQCKKSFPCDQGFLEGADCVRCTSAMVSRFVCCAAVEMGACDFSPTVVCADQNRWKGTPNASGNTACQTCTISTTWLMAGQCQNIKDAKSKKTCPN